MTWQKFVTLNYYSLSDDEGTFCRPSFFVCLYCLHLFSIKTFEETKTFSRLEVSPWSTGSGDYDFLFPGRLLKDSCQLKYSVKYLSILAKVIELLCKSNFLRFWQHILHILISIIIELIIFLYFCGKSFIYRANWSFIIVQLLLGVIKLTAMLQLWGQRYLTINLTTNKVLTDFCCVFQVQDINIEPTPHQLRVSQV